MLQFSCPLKFSFSLKTSEILQSDGTLRLINNLFLVIKRVWGFFKKRFNRKIQLLKSSTALMRTYLKYIYGPLQIYYGEKKIRSQGRSRSFVSWEDFRNEMFKVKETPVTQ